MYHVTGEHFIKNFNYMNCGGCYMKDIEMDETCEDEINKNRTKNFNWET